MHAPSWIDVGLKSRKINLARRIFNFRALSHRYKGKISLESSISISLRARQYCFAESREPKRACAYFL